MPSSREPNSLTAQRVRQALMSDNPDQRRIAEVGLDWIATLLDKNHDYGGSAWKTPVLAPTLTAGQAILVRMSDKISRLNTLMAGNDPKVGESINDTLKDLGAYALLYLAQPKPLTEWTFTSEPPCQITNTPIQPPTTSDAGQESQPANNESF